MKILPAPPEVPRPHDYLIGLSCEEYAVIGAALDEAVVIVLSAPDAHEGEAYMTRLVLALREEWDRHLQ